MHHSFAWCFFFYLSFLFPPVEPGVFNCCVTRKTPRRSTSERHINYILSAAEIGFDYLFVVEQILRGTLCGYCAGFEDIGAVGDGERLFRVLLDEQDGRAGLVIVLDLSLIHISEPTRLALLSRMPSSA